MNGLHCADSSVKLAKSKAAAIAKDTSILDVKTGQPSLTPFADAAPPVTVCRQHSLPSFSS